MKSDVSNQIGLLQCLLEDTCRQCTAYVSYKRDLDTIKSRLEHEGFSFLTITLPDFAKAFEHSLTVGCVGPSDFAGWQRCRLKPSRFARSRTKPGSIPAFLQGMTGLLFDKETGRIKDVPPKEASLIVGLVRQVCLLFKKIEAPCSPARTRKAFEEYVSTERSLAEFSPPDHLRTLFGCVADILWAPVLSGINPMELRPVHGPGQTADGFSGNRKYPQLTWHQRLEPFFPYIGSVMPLGITEKITGASLDPHSQGSLVRSVEGQALQVSEVDIRKESNTQLPLRTRIQLLEAGDVAQVSFPSEGQEPPVKVITVPKTLKGPRIIAMEPVCMQFAQQAIRDVLYQRIESTWPMSGRVNFSDQSINQSIALRSSSDGSFATIDLSEASDRVPRDLALRMFDTNIDLRDAIASCTSISAEVPILENKLELRKFASMGSALCFPVEAMYFYTCCVVSLLRLQNLPCTASNVTLVARDVYVYGDDILVPREHAVAILDYLQEYHCKVNLSKSFWSGHFRESCGMDAYAGYPVTPVYLRRMPPKNRRQASNVISWVATANQFYLSGMWTTAHRMFSMVERIVGELPYVSPTSEALGRITFQGGRSVHRWNRKYQRFELRGLVPRPIYRTDRIGGYAALAKSLTNLERKNLRASHDDPRGSWNLLGMSKAKDWTLEVRDQDPKHLERTALNGAVALTRRWVPA